jgi:hypothetical protein
MCGSTEFHHYFEIVAQSMREQKYFDTGKSKLLVLSCRPPTNVNALRKLIDEFHLDVRIYK